MSIPSDPLFSQQWHLKNNASGQFDLNVVDVWNDYTGKGVVIAVIDDGVEATHPDIAANYDNTKDYDSVQSSETLTLGQGPEVDSHGTSAAGIIAAVANNGIGGVGVAHGATIFGMKIDESKSDIIQSEIQLVSGETNVNGVNRSADIISMSLGTLDETYYFGVNYANGVPTSYDSEGAGIVSAMKYATENGRDGRGTIIVKSGGNERLQNGTTETNMSDWNASPFSISVAAVQRDGFVDTYSTIGSSLLVSAFGSPGEVVTTDRTGADGYDATSDYTSTFNGTSAAAPMVSGVVALMLEANENLGWRDVQSILALTARHTGTDIGSGTSGSEQIAWEFNGANSWNGGGLHFSDDYGFGLVDATAAVRVAETWIGAPATSQNQAKHTVDLLDADFTLTGDGTANNFTNNVTTNITVEHVGLTINFEELVNIEDLSIRIIGPDGTSSVVMFRPTSGSSLGANLEDSISLYGGTWDYFYSNAFRGISSQGEWNVELIDKDSATTSAVKISDLKLNFFGAANTEDDVFVYTNEYSDYVSDNKHSASLDGQGGVDTLNASAVSSGSTINLASQSANIDGVATNVANIENIFTGDGVDNITGNSSNNILGAGRGNDTIDGGAGVDTAKFVGEAKNFTIQINNGAATAVADRRGSEGTDSLTNIEKLDFSGDKDVNLSILSGVANVASSDLTAFVEMYIAYFNRAPDAEGLFYWGTRLSEGMSIQDIAKTFFVLDEAVAVYGGKSNSDLVDTVYQNFLGREAEVAGKEFWTDELDSGRVQKGEFLLAIINGAKAPTSLPSDANYIKNKADIGAYFSVIKGMGNGDNAKAAMALYDGTDTSKTAAKNAIDGFYNTASAADNGELLIQLVGVMDDPFAIA